MMFILGILLGAVLAVVAMMILQELSDRRRERKNWRDEMERSMERARVAHMWIETRGDLLQKNVRELYERVGAVEKRS